MRINQYFIFCFNVFSYLFDKQVQAVREAKSQYFINNCMAAMDYLQWDVINVTLLTVTLIFRVLSPKSDTDATVFNA